MSQITAITAPAAPVPVNRAYDYDGALKFIAVVRRAVDSADFHAGVVSGYTDSGRPAMAAAFTAAVEERREFDALEAEFASRPGSLRARALRIIKRVSR